MSLQIADGNNWVVERGLQVWVYGWINDIQLTFSKILNEAPLCEKKWWSTVNIITEININTIRAVIDDDRHLSTSALKALLHIHPMIIYCILTEKLEMVCVTSTCVPHILISDKMWIHIENVSKFLSHCKRFDLTEPNSDVRWDQGASLSPTCNY